MQLLNENLYIYYYGKNVVVDRLRNSSALVCAHTIELALCMWSCMLHACGDQLVQHFCVFCGRFSKKKNSNFL